MSDFNLDAWAAEQAAQAPPVPESVKRIIRALDREQR